MDFWDSVFISTLQSVTAYLGMWVRGLCGMTWSIYTVIGATVTVILGAVLLSIICTGSMPRKKTNILSLFKTYAYLIKNSDSCSRFQKHKVGKNIVFITLGLCFGSSTLLSFLFLVFGLLFVFFFTGKSL